MEVKHVRDLYEAYRQVHQPQEEVEQLDEFLGSGAATMVDKATKAVQGGLQKLGVPINRTPRGTVTGPQQKQKIEGNVKEDLFDIIKGHLLDEGYADTEEAALKIMANMSEEWRQSIVEDFPKVLNNYGTQGPNRSGDAGTRGLTKTPTGYINRHSRGEDLPPGTVNKIMGGNLMVKGQNKTDTKTA
jgi:hypothetical protein